MAWRKIREGNTTRILTEKEYRKEQSDKVAGACVGKLIQLGLSGWGAGYFFLEWCIGKWGMSNPFAMLGSSLGVFILIYIVLGKIGKTVFGSRE